MTLASPFMLVSGRCRVRAFSPTRAQRRARLELCGLPTSIALAKLPRPSPPDTACQGAALGAHNERSFIPVQPPLMPPRPAALLALADGTVFQGHSIGAAGHTVGEVVFNTALTGYQEILTDPSYAQQIVTLTYPHIGNYGVNAEDVEASKVHAAGLIIRDLPLMASSFRSDMTLQQYLQRENTVGISDIDTRKLTRILRTK